MGNKSSKSNRKRDDISRMAAEIHGVSSDYVRKIRRGERENEEIFATVMDLIEGKNKLVEEVKKLVPIDKKPEKRPKTTLGSIRNKGENGAELHLF